MHGWGVYAVVGLALAYAVHRRGRPMAMRSTLYPCSATGSTADSGTRWTCSPSSARCSASPPRSGSGRSRPARASSTSSAGPPTSPSSCGSSPSPRALPCSRWSAGSTGGSSG
ncbi:hypothetical protein FTX61_01795 [Nitriliruptoraceae bacterium ZYF776]|nr:hypothetical protein [Profundirhabdus halotolerans]